MAQIDTRDPKALVAGLLVCAGLVGGGSMLGLTVESQDTTDLRVEHGKLETKVKHLEEGLAECQKAAEEKQETKKARQQKGGK